MKSPISPRKFARLAPFIAQQLREQALGGAKSPPAAIRTLFVQLYGEDRSRAEELRFLYLAAPLARRVAIETCPPNEPFGEDLITVHDLKVTLAWLSTTDPQTLLMFDLRYFAGLSIRDISNALGMHHSAVLRGLRFVKGLLSVRLG